MSTSQIIASQRFVEAMGELVEDDIMVNKVIMYIENLRKQTPTVSHEKWNNLHSIDELDMVLKSNIRAFYES